jgi:perosamine synthetase
MRIPLSAPDLGTAEVDAVLAVLRSPHLSRGPRLEVFERELARRSGAAHAVATSSGTAALHLAVRALGLGEGDEVITTPFSFVASANCLLYERVRPVFVDIDPATRNLDPRRLEPAITARTRAILPVHVFGLPCAMDRVAAVAQGRGLAIVEDACEAIGATYRGRPTGSFGTVATFSFYPNKQVTTGEGGAVCTSDARLAAACRRMSNHGRDGDDDPVELGFNYRLSEIGAALGAAQLERLDDILAARERVAGWYDEELAERRGLRLPPRAGPGERQSWFVYVIELADPDLERRREAIIAALAARGVASRPYFQPIHLLAPYRDTFGHAPGDFPNAERLARRTLALPFSTRLSREAVATVAAELRHVVEGRAA